MNWWHKLPSLAPVKGFARFIITEAPTLRIVPEDLWRAAHERLDRTRQTYLRSTGGKLCGRPEAGLESKNLLAGFVTCGVCGGSMHAIKRTSKRGRPVRYYVCNGWRVNGSCDNALSLPMTALDTKILDTLKADVLTAEIVEVVVTRTIELARLEPDEHAEKRLRLTDDAERLATEIQRLTEAIIAGGTLASLVTALKDRERQRADALARLEHLDGLSRAPEWGDGIRDKLRARLPLPLCGVARSDITRLVPLLEIRVHKRPEGDRGRYGAPRSTHRGAGRDTSSGSCGSGIGEFLVLRLLRDQREQRA